MPPKARQGNRHDRRRKAVYARAGKRTSVCPRADSVLREGVEEMKNNFVTCDSCGRDITYTLNCEDYRLALKVESKDLDPKTGGCVNLVLIPPPIDNDADFCGVGCLRTWFNKTYPS